MERWGPARRADLATGASLSYVVVGDSGTMPVILLHAWGESRRSFDRLLAQLPTGICAVAVDQRGHGDAAEPSGGFSLKDFAGDVLSLMDALGIRRAVLLGSSSGGYVAQQVAVSHPTRVAGLVLVGSPRTLQGRPPFADEVEGLSDPVDVEWVRRSLTWFPTFQPVPDWYVEDRVQDGAGISARVWRETFSGLRLAIPPTESGAITAPTLIVCGERDDLLGREQQVELAGAIKDSRLVTYASTGHLVLWEQPERLAIDVATFLIGVPR